MKAPEQTWVWVADGQIHGTREKPTGWTSNSYTRTAALDRIVQEAVWETLEKLDAEVRGLFRPSESSSYLAGHADSLREVLDEIAALKGGEA